MECGRNEVRDKGMKGWRQEWSEGGSERVDGVGVGYEKGE